VLKHTLLLLGGRFRFRGTTRRRIGETRQGCVHFSALPGRFVLQGTRITTARSRCRMMLLGASFRVGEFASSRRAQMPARGD
jgi:hypothetical protein